MLERLVVPGLVWDLCLSRSAATLFEGLFHKNGIRDVHLLDVLLALVVVVEIRLLFFFEQLYHQQIVLDRGEDGSAVAVLGKQICSP